MPKSSAPGLFLSSLLSTKFQNGSDSLRNCWNTAHFLLVPKKGSKSLSINTTNRKTFMLTKILKEIIKGSLSCYLKMYHLIKDKQHGVRQQKFTANLTSIVNIVWNKYFELHEEPQVIVLDIFKIMYPSLLSPVYEPTQIN